MENSSTSGMSESDDDQYFDATEDIHTKNGTEEVDQGIRHLKLDDMFGKTEHVMNAPEEREPVNNDDEQTQTTTGAEIGNVKQLVCQQSGDAPIDPDAPPEIKLEKCNFEGNGTENDNLRHHCDDDNDSDNDDLSDDNIKETIKDELAARIEMEDKLSEEEKLERRDLGQQHKARGNGLFKNEEYLDACSVYTDALELCPLTFKKERSIMYSNRAACKLRLEQLEEAISDCTEALTLNPLYMKALLRRAQTYELTEKLDEALADYQKALELDAGCHEARRACMRLPNLIKERNEKLKEEMMGKLKDLGNMVLRPFGLSTSNFQFNQDPNTGSYSMNFVQNAGGSNGK
ncbi:tetratricopeptide repeat protein 1-like [Anneissia japonica]|uniref:tetratricopeptide repeat protein 1-like n=1 Tax=Anneissia japonica TaxID=1529436 RepID=UPI001425AC67|nr:tetratricopeptide repeat protein 1-like [Anneissia japonica]